MSGTCITLGHAVLHCPLFLTWPSQLPPDILLLQMHVTFWLVAMGRIDLSGFGGQLLFLFLCGVTCSLIYEIIYDRPILFPTRTEAQRRSFLLHLLIGYCHDMLTWELFTAHRFPLHLNSIRCSSGAVVGPHASQQEGSGSKSWVFWRVWGEDENQKLKKELELYPELWLIYSADMCVIKWHVVIVLVIKIELYSMSPCLICDKFTAAPCYVSHMLYIQSLNNGLTCSNWFAKGLCKQSPVAKSDQDIYWARANNGEKLFFFFLAILSCF